ncbi:MAG: hypothetical protein Kow0081_0050 [Candidatus Dojkabacteria bacterium]
MLLLCTATLAAINRITAQSIGNATLFETTDRYFNTPYSNSFVDLQDSSEVEVLTGGECSGNRLGGMVGEVADSLAEILGIPQGTSTYNNCAKTQLQKGNAKLYIEMLSSPTPGLYPTVFALNLEMLNQRPVSGTGFVEEKVYALQNAFTANAQSEPQLYYPGTGFDLLRPMQSFWGWIVNIVYGLMIIIIIFVAFGIMFRAQLPGGVAITLQNSIPNIALAMILIPLSYAITGLFIDGITVGVNVSHQLLLGAGSPGREVYLERDENFPRTGRIGGTIEDRGLFADDERVSWLYSSSYVNITDEFGDGIPALTQSFIGTDLGPLQGIFDFIAPLVNLAIGILLLFTGIRIFVLLFKKYIAFMIVGPLMSPLVFASVAIPGNGTKNIVGFVKFMGSGTLSFIAAYMMTLLAMILSTATFQANLAQAGISQYNPPLLGFDFATQIGGLVDTGVNSLIMAFVALGIYLSIPPTLKNIDSAMGVTGTIPAFISNIWQSARDSWNLAKATPGYIGKAAKSPFTAFDKVNSARIRINQAARNYLDIVRGRRPGEVGTGLQRKIQEAEEIIAKAEEERQKAIEQGGIAGAIKANAAKATIAYQKQLIEQYKASLGSSGDIDNPTDSQLTAQLTWEGKPFVEFEEFQVEDLAARYLAAGRGPFILQFAGKFVLKLEGKSAKFPPNTLNKLQLYTEKDGAAGDLVANNVTGMDFSNFFQESVSPPSFRIVNVMLPEEPRDPQTYEGKFDLEIIDLPSFISRANALGLAKTRAGVIRLVNYGYGAHIDSNPFDLRFKVKVSQKAFNAMI